MLTDLHIIADGLLFPEGPVALPGGDVLVVEMARGTLTRVAPDGTVTVVADVGGTPNGAAIGPDGRVYICQAGGLRFHRHDELLVPGRQSDDHRSGAIQAVDLESGDVSDLYTECDGHPLSAPNDLVFDRDGGLWFTDLGANRRRSADHGGVYFAQPDGSSVVEVVYPMMHPNGIGLSPGGKTLFVAETQRARLLGFKITAPGVVDHGGYRALAPASVPSLLGSGEAPTMFDSLAVDAAGHILIGTLNWRPGVTEFDPDNSRLILHELADIADPFPTNLCFGVDDPHAVFITCSATGRLAAGRWHRPGLPLAFGNGPS